MKGCTNYLVYVFLVGMAFNASAEQQKCIITSAGEDVSKAIEDVQKKCSPGDVIFYSPDEGVGIPVEVASSVCDFTKSIVTNDDEVACVYNGILKQKQ